MANEDHKSKNDNNINDLKRKNECKLLEKRKFELDIWKMRTITISNLIEKETQKKNEQRLLMVCFILFIIS